MTIFHILGSSSFIAKALSKELKLKNEVFCYSSKKSNKNSLNAFFKKNLRNSIIIYFCHIKDKLNGNLYLLNKTIKYCKKFNCKFIYISSINAQKPESSLYSLIKFKCEKEVKKNNYISLRLGVVTSKKPFGPYQSLLNIKKLPIQLIFQSNQILHMTKIDTFINFNFKKINSNQTLLDKAINLNEFLWQRNNKYLSIGLKLPIKLLRRINLIYPLKSIFGRFLTLVAFNKKII
jgi:hypothetical protein